MLFRGENGNDHCSWCHYLSCVPTSKWKCGNWFYEVVLCINLAILPFFFCLNYIHLFITFYFSHLCKCVDLDHGKFDYIGFINLYHMGISSHCMLRIPFRNSTKMMYCTFIFRSSIIFFSKYQESILHLLLVLKNPSNYRRKLWCNGNSVPPLHSAIGSHWIHSSKWI